MRRICLALIGLFSVMPPALAMTGGLVDSRSTLSELNLLITQYESRIKQLQAENEILRIEMVKAGIKIPLEQFSGSTTVKIPMNLDDIGLSTGAQNVNMTGSSQNTVFLTGGNTQNSGSLNIQSALSEVSRIHGKDVAGFISRINADWDAIKSNYAFPNNARLAGYEFVQSGSFDHVFANIMVGTGTTGVFDIKILYQFDKTDYKRKLIGLFYYDLTTQRYITRSGMNPFAGVPRIFVRDPFIVGTIAPPSTATSSVNSSTGSSSTTIPPSQSASASMTEITKAYNEKRYLSTITLSNSYLEKNPPNQEILSIRYRTYFIIGKYSESLAEIAKIETLGALDKQTACNAQVIATYSKNQALVDRYTAICKK